MKKVNNNHLNDLEALQKENLQLRRRNHELELSFKRLNEEISKNTALTESLSFQRDSFFDMAKRYAEELGLSIFKK
ncbi:MAG: hypothetical protein GY928_36340 [Colwellia sp.]|nr:hypothetical protein [Colwellia sp.]